MTDQLTPERTTEVTPSAPTGPGLAVAVGTTVAFTALVLTMVIGGSAPQPPAVGLPDPGPLVGWLLPSLTLVADLAAIVVIGSVAGFAG